MGLQGLLENKQYTNRIIFHTKASVEKVGCYCFGLTSVKIVPI